jgi:hypothetical protein
MDGTAIGTSGEPKQVDPPATLSTAGDPLRDALCDALVFETHAPGA